MTKRYGKRLMGLLLSGLLAGMLVFPAYAEETEIPEEGMEQQEVVIEEIDSEDTLAEDPEGEDPEGEDPEGEDPEGEDPEGEDPEGEDPEGEDPEEEWEEEPEVEILFGEFPTEEVISGDTFEFSVIVNTEEDTTDWYLDVEPLSEYDWATSEENDTIVSGQAVHFTYKVNSRVGGIFYVNLFRSREDAENYLETGEDEYMPFTYAESPELKVLERITSHMTFDIPEKDGKSYVYADVPYAFEVEFQNNANREIKDARVELFSSMHTDGMNWEASWNIDGKDYKRADSYQIGTIAPLGKVTISGTITFPAEGIGDYATWMASLRSGDEDLAEAYSGNYLTSYYFDILEQPGTAATPTATPVPTATPAVTATPEATVTPEVTVTPAVTATPEAIVTPAATATPTVTAVPEATATPTPTSTVPQTGDTTDLLLWIGLMAVSLGVLGSVIFGKRIMK